MSRSISADGALLFDTSLGPFVVDLFPSLSPKAIWNVIRMAQENYYDGDLFCFIQKRGFAKFGRSYDANYANTPPVQPHIFMNQSNSCGGFETSFGSTPKDLLTYGSLFLSKCPDSRHQTSQLILSLSHSFSIVSRLAEKCGDLIGVTKDGLGTLERLNKVLTSSHGVPLRKVKIRRVHVLVEPHNALVSEGLSPLVRNAMIEQLHFHAEYQANMKALESDTESDSLCNLDAIKTERHEQILKLLGRRDSHSTSLEEPIRTLFVCKLNPLTTKEGLTQFFEQFGPLLEIQMPSDAKTQRSLQYAFVEFESVDDCRKAYINANGVLLDDRRILVDFSHSTRRRKRMLQNSDTDNIVHRDS